MSLHIKPGDMAEGQKTRIETRRIEFKKRSLQKHEITQKLMVAYTMDRNCTVEVIEEIELTEEERALRAPYPIHGSVGDTLKAEAIRLFVAGKRDLLGGEVKEGVSHRHGATVINCPHHVLASITTPWQGHLHILEMTANNIQPKQIQE